jgi:phosphoglycerol transferase MdoB-like AlkP superfamily enzyme
MRPANLNPGTTRTGQQLTAHQRIDAMLLPFCFGLVTFRRFLDRQLALFALFFLYFLVASPSPKLTPLSGKVMLMWVLVLVSLLWAAMSFFSFSRTTTSFAVRAQDNSY